MSSRKYKVSPFRKYRLPFLPRPRGWRPQWMPWFMGLNRESDLHPHVAEEEAERFLSYGGISTEAEVLNWLHATILLLKPQNILETGTAGGLGTIALAAACKANGFGHLHSLEYEEGYCEKVKGRLASQGLSKWATLHHTDSLDFLRQTDIHFDFGFFDSLTELRPQEYMICRERNLIGQVAAFHDTSKHRVDEYTKPEVQQALPR